MNFIYSLVNCFWRFRIILHTKVSLWVKMAHVWLTWKQQSRRVKFRLICECHRSMRLIFVQGEIVWPVGARAEGELVWFPQQCRPMLKSHVLLRAGAKVRKGRKCLQMPTLNPCAVPTRCEMLYPQDSDFSILLGAFQTAILSQSYVCPVAVLHCQALQSNYILCKIHLGNQVFC